MTSKKQIFEWEKDRKFGPWNRYPDKTIYGDIGCSREAVVAAYIVFCFYSFVFYNGTPSLADASCTQISSIHRIRS